MARSDTYADKNGKDKPTRKQGKVGEDGEAVFRGYVNLNLTDGQKVEWLHWSETNAVWGVLDSSVRSGVVVSLKTDARSGGYVASATQRRASSPNAGLVVTARGKEPGIALSRLCFCLEVLGATPRWEDTQPMADPDRW